MSDTINSEAVSQAEVLLEDMRDALGGTYDAQKEAFAALATAYLAQADRITALEAELARANRNSERRHKAAMGFREEWAAMRKERDALAGKLAEAVEAMKELHDDMLERSRLGMDVIRGEQYRVVNAGNGAWTRFCVTLAKLEASHDAD